MNSQPASRAASQASRYSSQAEPLTANVGVIERACSTSRKRQNPARMPYSCQAQLGRSGSRGWPMGGGSTVRGMAAAGLQCSTLTMVHTASRAPPGSLSGGRLCGGVWSRRWRKL